jgi:hypothetical protein
VKKIYCEEGMGERKEETRALQIRFTAPVYRKLKARSKENRRSLNAEVLVSLERFFAAEEAISEASRGKEDG